MYVAVKGGEKAITAAHELLAEERRGDPTVPELSVKQIQSQLSLAVDRVMAEGSLYDRELAALAIKQARGDSLEAIFLLRAYRTTLSRFGSTEPVNTLDMVVKRRVSAAFKDLPGGQVLGPTFDYTHRILDFSLLDNDSTSETNTPPDLPDSEPTGPMKTRISDIIGQEDLIEVDEIGETGPVGDLTREPLSFPASRDIRLQNLARGDEGFLLSMAYSYQRGFGASQHPFTGEIRMGEVTVSFIPEELGFEVDIGVVELTECVMISAFRGSSQQPPQYSKGYGLSFGYNERKVMAMSMVDRAMRWEEFDEDPVYPVQNQEFVLYHSDNVEASGFVQHLKLPHYVDFQSDLVIMRGVKKDYDEQTGGGPADEKRKTVPGASCTAG